MCVCVFVFFWLKSASNVEAMASSRQRLSSTLSDDELRELVKLHMPENPLKRLSVYRAASFQEVCQLQAQFFLAVAVKGSRLNKIQLLGALLKLHKGDKNEMGEVAAKMSVCYAAALSHRKNTTTGQKLMPCVWRIIEAFTKTDDDDISGSVDSLPTPSPPVHSKPQAASSSSGDSAEELLRMARERFQVNSPPSKVSTFISLVDSPALIQDSPLQASSKTSRTSSTRHQQWCVAHHYNTDLSEPECSG